MTAFDDEGGLVKKRRLVAVTATTIKASSSLSSTLDTHEKLVVAKGARVTAVIEEEREQHWKIADATSDDAPLPDGLNFLYINHWELQAEAAAEATTLEEDKPAHELLVHNEPAPPATDAAGDITVRPVPEPSWTPTKPAIGFVTNSISKKPTNHRRLLSLFKRNAQKNLQND
jgi:hypothetical protein